MTLAFSTILSRIGWFAATLMVALGSAGLVTALDHRPSSGARAELTYAADQVLRPRLEAVVRDLDPIALELDALGSQGRAALSALVAANPDTLDKAVTNGQTIVLKIGVEVPALRERLARLPGLGPGAEGRISADLLARVATVTKTLDSTAGISQAWAVLSTGASSASRLAVLLSSHDEFSGEAVNQGSQGNYLAAVKALDKADPVLTQARTLRDRLANVADVATLTQWLDRNGAIDSALRRLYTALEVTNGKVTEEARQAFDAVKQAQSQLPPDTRALVVIMSDIARAGLNQAVIRIEELRGKLADAIAALRQTPAASPTPASTGAPAGSGDPGASGSPEITPPDA